MSYIRCLSNPEGLYVYHDVSGHISISSTESGVNIKYDFERFNKFMLEYINFLDQVQNEFPFTSNGIEVWEDATNEYKICLAIPQNGKIKRIYMYRVTWVYLVNSFRWNKELTFINKIIYIIKNWYKIGRSI